MNFVSFREWVVLKEGRKDRTYQTSEPKVSDTERLSRGKGIKIDADQKKERVPTGRPASACGIGSGKKYDRRKFKRIED